MKEIDIYAHSRCLIAALLLTIGYEIFKIGYPLVFLSRGLDSGHKDSGMRWGRKFWGDGVFLIRCITLAANFRADYCYKYVIKLL